LSLRTRLDPRSLDNNRIYIKDSSGNTIAVVRVHGKRSTTLEVLTEIGFHLEKENGWSSDGLQPSHNTD